MKKILFIALSLMLAFSFCLSSFADWGTWIGNEADMEEVPSDGMPVNSKDTSTSALDLRHYWTPSRNGDNTADSTNTDTYNTDSVTVVTEDGEKYLKLVAPQWINCDNAFEDEAEFGADYMLSEINGFAGMITGYGDDYLDLEVGQNTQNDYYYHLFEAVNSDMEYVMATGYGMTFVPGSNSKIRVFARTLEGTNFGVISYDIDTGDNLAEEFHTYGICVNPYGEVQFKYDDLLIATLEFTGEEKLSAVETSYQPLNGSYYRNAVIKNSQGVKIAESSTALISSNGMVVYAFQGEGTTVFVDNVYTKSTPEWPDEALILEGDATPEAKATEVPADPTEAPAEEATEAPAEEATEAPAEEATAEPETKSGCGSVIAMGSVIVMAAAVMVIRKKR